MTSIFFFVLFGSLAYGHNWMQAPPSYNGNKATANNMPCPTKTSTYAPALNPFGEDITVTWTTNHGGLHYVKVVHITELALVQTKPTGELLYYFEGDKAAGKTSVIPINDTTKYQVGQTYLIQYTWNNYANCAEFTVGEAIITPTQSPTGPGGTDSPTKFRDTIGLGDCNSYCEDFQRQCNTTEYAYDSLNACLDACARFPTSGEYRSPTGNTFQCRWYHLHPDPGHQPDDVVHCGHASKESLKNYCVGTEKLLPAANARIKLTSGAVVTPEEMQQHVQNCLTKWGYTSLTVATPIEGSGSYTVPIIFAKIEKGENELQKIASLKVDTQIKYCLENKPGIESFTVANTDFDDSLGGGNRESPAMILSAVAILLYIFFQ